MNAMSLPQIGDYVRVITKARSPEYLCGHIAKIHPGLLLSIRMVTFSGGWIFRDLHWSRVKEIKVLSQAA